VMEQMELMAPRYADDRDAASEAECPGPHGRPGNAPGPKREACARTWRPHPLDRARTRQTGADTRKGLLHG
jgi:hypothetical protein